MCTAVVGHGVAILVPIYLQTYFVFLFEKNILSKIFLEKKFCQFYFSVHIFAIFFGQMPDNN